MNEQIDVIDFIVNALNLFLTKWNKFIHTKQDTILGMFQPRPLEAIPTIHVMVDIASEVVGTILFNKKEGVISLTNTTKRHISGILPERMKLIEYIFGNIMNIFEKVQANKEFRLVDILIKHKSRACTIFDSAKLPNILQLLQNREYLNSTQLEMINGMLNHRLMFVYCSLLEINTLHLREDLQPLYDMGNGYILSVRRTTKYPPHVPKLLKLKSEKLIQKIV